MPNTRSRFGAARSSPAIGLAVLLLGACGKSPQAGEAPSAQPSASAPAASTTTPPKDPTEREGADEVKANYPVTNEPPDPLAVKLCHALWDVAVEKKTACCPGTREPAFGGECARVVSAAIRLKGATIAAPDVDACVAAIEKQTSGCDWVGAGIPRAPAACVAIVKGTLAEKAKCRSSLECGAGLTCIGVGPTTIGTCVKPLVDGSFCGTAVDPLASMARAEDYEANHPACAGVCYRNRCIPRVASGAACKGNVECGSGSHCVSGKCSDAPLPRVGEACAGLCTPDARCVKDKCEPFKAVGDECLTGFECQSGHCSPHETGLGKCESPCAPMHFPPNPTALPVTKPPTKD